MSGRRLIGVARSAAVAATLTAGLALAACSSHTGQSGAGTTGASAAAGSSSVETSAAPSTPTRPPATITFNQPAGATDVNPTVPLTVTAGNGSLTDVVMTNGAGDQVKGQLAPDHLSWTTGEVLGYDRNYTVTAHAANSAGDVATQTLSFSTLKPRNMTMPYIDTAGGYALDDGATYGVGMVVAVHFDEEVDKAKAEKTLRVTTSPAVEGSWYWLDDQNVHWRPKDYYQPGTKVTVTAKVYGVDVGTSPGLYGQSDVTKSFTIGAKHVSVADDNTHQVKVYFNDQLVRTMPTSMGRGGSVVVNGKTISFWTQPGTYTVLGKANPVLMDSSTYGLPVNSKLGYKENIYWATRISTDGVYLHQLDSTVWAQGNTDTSHGCLNLNRSNAQWFYGNAQIGDVVQVLHTGGSPLAVWQGGDWTLSWDAWKAGSALS